jgi:hypothetical protein
LRDGSSGSKHYFFLLKNQSKASAPIPTVEYKATEGKLIFPSAARILRIDGLGGGATTTGGGGGATSLGSISAGGSLGGGAFFFFFPNKLKPESPGGEQAQSSIIFSFLTKQ